MYPCVFWTMPFLSPFSYFHIWCNSEQVHCSAFTRFFSIRSHWCSQQAPWGFWFLCGRRGSHRAVQHSLFVRAASELCQVIISARIPRSHPFWQYSSEFSVGEIIYCCKYSPVKLYVLLFPQLSEPFMVIIQWLNRQAWQPSNFHTSYAASKKKVKN